MVLIWLDVIFWLSVYYPADWQNTVLIPSIRSVQWQCATRISRPPTAPSPSQLALSPKCLRLVNTGTNILFSNSKKTQHVWVLSNLSYFDRISLSLKYFQSVLGKGSHPDLKWNSFWGLFWAFLFLVLLVIVISSFGGIRKTHLIAEREAGFKSLMQVQTFAVAN